MIDETDDTDVAVKSALQSEYRAMLVKLPTRVEQGNAQHMTVDSDDLIVYAMSNGHWPVPVINSQLGKRVIAGAHDSLVMVHIGSRKSYTGSDNDTGGGAWRLTSTITPEHASCARR